MPATKEIYFTVCSEVYVIQATSPEKRVANTLEPDLEISGPTKDMDLEVLKVHDFYGPAGGNEPYTTSPNCARRDYDVLCL